ncbi:MAG: META domain-containing protein [Eikenella sp.]|nr:META domain-containing protein [Eikenella sp.]
MMKALALFAAAALLAACAQTRPGGRAAPSFDGQWRVVQVGGQQVDNPQAVLSFDAAAQRFSANVGCNNLFGGFTRPGGGLLFGQTASTLKMCDEAAMQLDRRTLAALEQTRRYRGDGQTLELTDGNGQTVLRAVR